MTSCFRARTTTNPILSMKGLPENHKLASKSGVDTFASYKNSKKTLINYIDFAN